MKGNIKKLAVRAKGIVKMRKTISASAKPSKRPEEKQAELLPELRFPVTAVIYSRTG